jgi:hypothetical protein
MKIFIFYLFLLDNIISITYIFGKYPRGRTLLGRYQHHACLDTRSILLSGIEVISRRQFMYNQI